VGGLPLNIDAFALVDLAGKYASGGGGTGDSGLLFARWDEAMARQESLAPTRALPAPGCLRCYPLNRNTLVSL